MSDSPVESRTEEWSMSEARRRTPLCHPDGSLCRRGTPAADDVSLNKDLMAVIALQGLPCAQVVSVKQQGDNDYIAS